MKTQFKLTRLVLILSVALTSVVLTQPAGAIGKDSEHVTITEPIMVAGTMLKPATYKVVWEGSGPEVQVRFMKDSKTIVTTSARIVPEISPYDGAVKLKVIGDNSKVLEAITWKKKSLVFEPPG